MSTQFYYSSIVYLVVSITGIVIGSILIAFRSSRFYRQNYYLGLAILFLSISIAFGFLIQSGLIKEVLPIYRFGNVFTMMFMPFSFFYIRSVTKHERISLGDFMYFLPILVYLVDFMPVFLLSNHEKLKLIETAHELGTHNLAFAEGWLTPPYFHLYFRHLVFLGFWLLQLKLLLNIRPNAAFWQENKQWYSWIWLYQLHQVFYILPLIFYLLIQPSSNIRLFSQGFAIICLFALCIYLLFKPSILYGIQGVLTPDKGKSTLVKSQPSSNYFPKEQVNSIVSKLDLQMKTNKSFLIKGYALYDLAHELDIAPRIISSILNKKLHTNFNEYINKYRIEFCIKLIKEGAHQTKTIEALANDCGFNNRNSFIKAFKNVKNITPSEYIKSTIQQ